MRDDPRLEHEIRREAARAGIDIEGRCPIEILDAWAEWTITEKLAREHRLARGRELEAENRELRAKLRGLDGNR